MHRGRAAALTSAIALGAIALVAFPYTVDDAYVIGRYAARLASGRGWTMVDGPPTDGVTGPLAIAPGVLAALIGLDPVLASKIAGLGCAMIAVALATVRAASGAGGRARGWLFSALTISSAPLVIGPIAGLETGMALLGATIAWLAASARRGPHGLALGGSVAALAWLRPELAFASAALIAGSAARSRSAAIRALAIGGCGAVAMLLFRASMFGSPIPLSWDAKPGELARGLAYASFGTLRIGAMGVGLALAWIGGRASPRHGIVLGALGAHVIAIAAAGGDWMPGLRLFVPLVPAFLWLAATGGETLMRRRPRLALVLVAIAVLASAADLAIEVVSAREAGMRRERVARPLAHALASRARGRAVAMVDVGFLAYEGALEEVLDLGGIADPAIGRLPGSHLDKPLAPATLAERDVGVLVLRSFERPAIRDGRVERLVASPIEARLASAAEVRDAFDAVEVTEYHPRYWYVILERRR